MSFATLALISAVALIGPLLAARRGIPVLVIVIELAVGVVLGSTGFGLLDPDDPTFTLLAEIGFALVLFIAGSYVPLRDPLVRKGLAFGAIRAAIIGIIAVPLGLGVAALFGTDHGFLYAVLIASSSATFAVQALKGDTNGDENDDENDEKAVGGDASDDDATGDRYSETGAPSDDPRLPPEPGSIGATIAQVIPQVAIADAVCIVLLPLAIDPPKAGTAALGALAVIVAAGVVFLLLRWIERSGMRRRVKKASEDRGLAIELRASLTILFALAALATLTSVSIMLAGFAFGFAVAAIGTPRRLTKQLFALTEGFFAPVFYVWLGASLGLGALVEHPAGILLGLALGAAAILAHLGGMLTRQRPAAAILTAAQLGVPIAAATTGLSVGIFEPGEDAALLLGAAVTITVCSIAGRRVFGRSSS